MNDTQIESLLRKAPKSAAPVGLKQQLFTDIRLPRPQQGALPKAIDVAPFWRRWFPALSLGLLFLGCFIVLGVQTSQLLRLRRENEGLRASTANLEQLRQDNAELEKLRSASLEAERLRKDNDELLKLKLEAAELRNRAQELTLLRAENQRLQAERAAMLAQAGAPPEDDPFAKAKEKAFATRCINNLKQIGLAARMWANEHKTSVLPTDWLAIKNELPTPKMLTCPADTGRMPVSSWDQFDGSSVSYELPSAMPDGREPHTVYARCTVHGSIGMTDGSAIMKMNPAQLEQVDGNLKLRINATKGPKP